MSRQTGDTTPTIADIEAEPAAGNHATGLAWAASTAHVPVTVVMPENASPMRAQAAQALGAMIERVGGINGAWNRAHQLANAGSTLVPRTTSRAS